MFSWFYPFTNEPNRVQRVHYAPVHFAMSMNFSSEFGERLRQERERLGFSQAEFAEKAGVHRNTQVRYESGKREPDTDYVARVTNFGVDFGYLVFGRRTDDISVYSLAVAAVLPGIAQRAGLSGRALLKILDLAANRESESWGPGPHKERGKVDLSYLIDALFENGDLLADIFDEVILAFHSQGKPLGYVQLGQMATMLFRAFKASGTVDPKMIEEAVTLAAV